MEIYTYPTKVLETISTTFDFEKDKTRELTDAFIRLPVTNIEEIWDLLEEHDRTPKWSTYSLKSHLLSAD